MADKTHISWSDATWNPVTGCTKVSDGCLNCYIDRTPPFRMAHRRFDLPIIGGTTGVQLHPDRLTIPLHWRKPRRIFVCSLADLFHEDVPDEYIARIWVVMAATPQHSYQVLTKRHARMRSLLASPDFQLLAGRAAFDFMQVHQRPVNWSWPLPNVWVGASVETQQWADIRIPALLHTPAAVHWLSCEPLLGPVKLDPAWLGPAFSSCDADYSNPRVAPMLAEIARAAVRHHARVTGDPTPAYVDWIVTGGESGPGARPAHPDWFRSLRDQCASAGIAYHHKQNGEYTHVQPATGRGPTTNVSWWNGSTSTDAVPGPTWHPVWRVGKKAAGRELDGQVHDAYPGVTHG